MPAMVMVAQCRRLRHDPDVAMTGMAVTADGDEKSRTRMHPKAVARDYPLTTTRVSLHRCEAEPVIDLDLVFLH